MRFGTISAVMKLIPVRLPPGRGMLETKPAVTGSTPLTNTMGTVGVARLAATAEETGVATRMSIFDSRSPAPLQEGGRNLHPPPHRSEEHTSELQSRVDIS